MNMRPRATLLLVLATSACAPGPEASPFDRPSDGLLEAPSLQRVVDAQVDRDPTRLLGLLGDADPLVRARAAFALGTVQSPGVRPALFEGLDDSDARVRADAAFAIGQLSDTTNSALLVVRLRAETERTVRTELIDAIGKTGGREAEALLLRTEFDPEERPALALALGRMGLRGLNNAVAVEELVSMTGDANPEVRERAAWYFARSSGSRFWAPVVERLRERLDGYDAADRAAPWLLTALTGFANESDAARGRDWLQKGELWTTRVAAVALAETRRGIQATKTAFTAALSDSSPHVRQAAARALEARAEELTDQERLFVQVWIDEHASDLGTVGQVLPILARRTAGEPVVEWMARFEPESPEVGVGLRALTGIPGPIARASLLSAAAGESENARIALEALVDRGPGDQTTPEVRARVLEVGLKALASGDSKRIQLGAALVAAPDFADRGALGALAAAYEARTAPADLETQAILLQALAATGDPGALPIVRAALDSPYRSLRAAAAEAVRALSTDAPSVELGTDPADRTVDWSALFDFGARPRVALVTEAGEVVLELDGEGAPLTTLAFAQLVQAGRLDGTPFHRVVAPFVVQGGDVTEGSGSGAAPYRIRSEFTRATFSAGTVGMASSGKDTEASQFFITHVMTPHLDGDYTVFGRVVSGMDVLDQVQQGDLLVRARLLARP